MERCGFTALIARDTLSFSITPRPPAPRPGGAARRGGGGARTQHSLPRPPPLFDRMQGEKVNTARVWPR